MTESGGKKWDCSWRGGEDPEKVCSSGWLVWFSLVFVYKIGEIIACLCPHQKDIKNYQCRREKDESCSSEVTEQATLDGKRRLCQRKQAVQPQYPERGECSRRSAGKRLEVVVPTAKGSGCAKAKS